VSRWVDEVHDDDFEQVLQTEALLFVDFYTDWCGPCRAVAPVIDNVARAFAGRARFVKLNTDDNPRTARRFGIRSIPTMIVFKHGRPVAGLSGYQPESNLRAMLASHVSGQPSPAADRAPQRSLLARMLRRAS
jgi:thioredoxin